MPFNLFSILLSPAHSFSYDTRIKIWNANLNYEEDNIDNSSSIVPKTRRIDTILSKCFINGYAQAETTTLYGLTFFYAFIRRL